MIHRQYTTSCEKKERAKTALSVIVLLFMITLSILVYTNKEPTGWDVSYPMANAKIEWEGAGYNGVYRSN